MGGRVAAAADRAVTAAAAVVYTALRCSALSFSRESNSLRARL